MSRYDDAPDTAEADFRRVSDALSRIDDEIAELTDQANQIEEEEASTPEEEQDISRRMGEVDEKLDALRSDQASTEYELSNLQSFWLE